MLFRSIEGDEKEWVVVFDFLGKDSIRYFNEVPVEKRVYKNLKHFMENKRTGDDLFDRLNVSIMMIELSINFVLLLLIALSLCILDHHSERTLEKSHGWAVRQSIPYVQCISHSSAAIG